MMVLPFFFFGFVLREADFVGFFDCLCMDSLWFPFPRRWPM